MRATSSQSTYKLVLTCHILFLKTTENDYCLFASMRKWVANLVLNLLPSELW